MAIRRRVVRLTGGALAFFWLFVEYGNDLPLTMTGPLFQESSTVPQRRPPALRHGRPPPGLPGSPPSAAGSGGDRS